MTPDTASLGQWFYTNAPAAWMSAFIALSSLVFVLISRKRPNRVLVRLDSASSLVKIWRGIREQISLTFDNQPIKKLGQLEFTITNAGSEVIKQVRLCFTLPDESRVLGVHVTPADFDAGISLDQNKFSLVLPYLNTKKHHDHVVDVTALVDGSLDPVDVAGGGEGWSIRFQGLPTEQQVKHNENVLGILFVALLIGSILYAKFIVVLYLGIPANEFSFRALAATLPMLAGLGIVMIFMARSYAHLRSRVRPKKRTKGADDQAYE